MLIQHTGICQHCAESVSVLVNSGKMLGDCPSCGQPPFKTRRMPGLIYVVSNPHQEGVKIGMTEKSFEQRLRSLSSTGVPGSFEPIVIFPSNRPRIDEARVHEKLKKHRLEKEHFKIEPVAAALGAYRALNRRKPIFFNKKIKESFYSRLDDARKKMKQALQGTAVR